MSCFHLIFTSFPRELSL